MFFGASSPGRKTFTEIPRHRLPAAFSAARFAPRSPQSLAASFRGAKSSQKFRAAACPPADISAARFAPRSQQSLAASFRGAKSSQRFRAAICLRRPFQRSDLLPAPRKALRLRSGEQNLHRNSAPVRATGDSCWRCPAGKRLYHRRATPTGRPKSRPAADHVGAVPPANAYITVGPRQQGAPNPARRPTLLAPPLRQSLDPPSGHANRAPRL